MSCLRPQNFLNRTKGSYSFSVWSASFLLLTCPATILAFGNYINGGTSRGGCYGFTLASLQALAELRSTKTRGVTIS
jgi:hypothetical protein